MHQHANWWPHLTWVRRGSQGLCVCLPRRSPGVPGQPLRGERHVAAAPAGCHPGRPAGGGVPGDRHHQRRHAGLQLVPCGAGRIQLGAALQMGPRSPFWARRSRRSYCTNKVRFLPCVWKTPKRGNLLKDNSFSCAGSKSVGLTCLSIKNFWVLTEFYVLCQVLRKDLWIRNCPGPQGFIS